MILADDIVMSYWALGPSYRTSLIRNLKNRILKREDIFKIVILTDCVEDFKEFYDHEKIIAILDLDTQRKHFTWSFEVEPLPVSKTQKEYSEEFWNILHNGRRFSYSLHRFSIPWILANGFHKFILIDTDTYIGHTSITMQEWVNACLDKGTVLVAHGDARKSGALFDKFYTTMTTGIHERFPNLVIPDVPEDYRHQDGPFRFYNFDSCTSAMAYFELWNYLTYYILTHHVFALTEILMYGGIFYNDEFTLGMVNYILGIEHTLISPPAIVVDHDPHRERFFALTHGSHQPAATYEEFLSTNNLTTTSTLSEFNTNAGNIT